MKSHPPDDLSPAGAGATARSGGADEAAELIEAARKAGAASVPETAVRSTAAVAAGATDGARASYTAGPTDAADVSDAIDAADVSDAIDAAAAADGAEPDRLRGIRVSLCLLALVATGAALWFGKQMFLPIVLAVLLALLLAPAVEFGERFRLPRWLGSLIVVVALVAGAVAAVTQVAVPAQQWLNPKSTEFRKLESRIRELLAPLKQLEGARDRVAEATNGGGARPREVVVERGDSLWVLRNAQPVMAGVVSTVVLLFFLLASGDLFLRKLIRVLPTLDDKKRAVGIARTIQVEIGRYFLTIAAINVGLGLVTAAVLTALGMPSPAFWGMLVAILNFVPYAGPATSLVLLGAGALISMDNWVSISAVPLSFLVLTVIEGQFLQPVLIGRRLRLNVVVTFLSIVLWGWLWGLGGIIVAVPILVVLKICADHVDNEPMKAIGELVSQ